VPTPSRTSLVAIVAAGRRLIESEGLTGLAMRRVADEVGVQPPSLYKHMTGRSQLIRLIAEDVLGDLMNSLNAAVTGDDPRANLVALAGAFRRFAHENPGAYALIFTPLPEESRPDPNLLTKTGDQVLRIAEALAGAEHSLEAARTITAWAHGFVAMELAGAFRMGGNIDEAFTFGAARLGEALDSR